MNLALQPTKHTLYHQQLAAEQQQQRDTHAVANGRKDVGPLNEGSNRCWHATRGKEEASWERGCWVLGAGERGLPRGPATATESSKGLSNLRVSSYSPCTPAACFVALAASAQACVWQGRRFHDVAYLLLKTTPGTWHANFAHTHTQLLVRAYVGVDFDL